MTAPDNGHRILVIDDDAELRRLVEEFLGGYGYQVIGAADGEAGVRLAEERRPDLILLDVDMPGLDGYQTRRRLQACEATRDIPVMFLTAVGRDEEHLARAFGVGAIDFITKPFSRVDLNVRVMSAIRRHAVFDAGVR